MPDVLCLGDLVGYGPFPNEVAALLRERAIPTVMGNYDQGIGFETGDCGCAYKTDEQRAEGAASLAWTEQATTPETRAYLRTLEDRFVLETPAGELLAVHGSPRRINEYLFEDRPETSLGPPGRGEPLSGHHLRPHPHPLRPRGRRHGLRQRGQRRTAQGRRLAGLLRADRAARGRATAVSPSSSCACRTTTRDSWRRWPRPT